MREGNFQNDSRGEPLDRVGNPLTPALSPSKEEREKRAPQRLGRSLSPRRGEGRVRGRFFEWSALCRNHQYGL